MESVELTDNEPDSIGTHCCKCLLRADGHWADLSGESYSFRGAPGTTGSTVRYVSECCDAELIKCKSWLLPVLHLSTA